MKPICIYADGASRGNKGDSAIGIVITDFNGNVIRKKSKPIGVKTCNEAEYLALIESLEYACEHTRGEIVYHSDSQLIINHMTGTFKLKATHLKPLFDKAKTLENRFKKVTYIHIPRENEYLILADKLANQALDRGLQTNHIEEER